MALAQKAGFDFENIDPSLRLAAHQEQVNKRVLSEYIRIVKMSDPFWQFFINEGRKRLMDYNRKEKSNVRVIRDQTIPMSDLENLSLYLRKKIKQHYQSKKAVPPEMSVKNGYITITSSSGERKRMRATELAVMLGWEYNDWQCICIRKLLTNTEKNLAKLSANTEVATVDKVRKRALAKIDEEGENIPPKCKPKLNIRE
ncbi:hypothetical protein RB195_014978 [Necator americanus]|uniref:Uncharacterized protein n=1 Tax=Necator americanus TaxID=51031 RepID=A0ABR1E2F4_NECAM